MKRKAAKLLLGVIYLTEAVVGWGFLLSVFGTLLTLTIGPVFYLIYLSRTETLQLALLQRDSLAGWLCLFAVLFELVMALWALLNYLPQIWDAYKGMKSNLAEIARTPVPAPELEGLSKKGALSEPERKAGQVSIAG